MAAYSFDSITGAQALAFNSATDTVSFPSGVTAASLTIFSGGGQTVVTSGGMTVTFGAGFTGQTGALFSDGSRLFLGGGGADAFTGGAGRDLAIGGDGADNLGGGEGNDSLRGGFGDDQLQGGRGADTIEGGAGADTFVVNQGDSSPASPDVISDWSSDDRITINNSAGAYQETSAPDAGRTHANGLIAAGARYVAVQTPQGVIVYIDTAGDGGTAEDAVLLAGRGLDDISGANLGAASTLPTAPMGPAEPTAPPPTTPPTTPTSPTAAVPATPTLPAPVPIAAFSTSAEIRGNMDVARLSNLLGADIVAATSTHLRIEGDIFTGEFYLPILDLVGSGFVYDSNSQILDGSVTQIIFVQEDFATQMFASPGISATQFGRWVQTNATQEAFSTILAGSDRLGGFVGPDLIRGYAGADLLAGSSGNDTIFGGLGNDQIYAFLAQPGINLDTATSYLRGDEGDDYIVGFNGFDDINGNMGNDTASGGADADWVVGGKDNDLLFGDAADDLVYGNLGNDTCVGGTGNDIVRGGQDGDLIFGGDGADYMSGDKGDDTVIGGAGADSFHTFGDAGLDRVLDFSLAEGDRVQLDPGTQYTVTQVGADTVIDMTGGGRMVLVGVQMSSLTPGWIFGA